MIYISYWFLMDLLPSCFACETICNLCYTEGNYDIGHEKYGNTILILLQIQ